MKDENQETGANSQQESLECLARYVCITASIVPSDGGRELGTRTAKDEITVNLEDGQNPLEVILATTPLVINRIAPLAVGFEEPMLMLEFEYYRLPDAGDCIWTNITVGATEVPQGDVLPVFHDMANKLKVALQQALGGAK